MPVPGRVPGPDADAVLLWPSAGPEDPAVPGDPAGGRAAPERWTTGEAGADGADGVERPAASRWMGGPTGVAAGAGEVTELFGTGPGIGLRTGTEVEPSGGSVARLSVPSTVPPTVPPTDFPGPVRRWTAGETTPGAVVPGGGAPAGVPRVTGGGVDTGVVGGVTAAAFVRGWTAGVSPVRAAGASVPAVRRWTAGVSPGAVARGPEAGAAAVAGPARCGAAGAVGPVVPGLARRWTAGVPSGAVARGPEAGAAGLAVAGSAWCGAAGAAVPGVVVRADGAVAGTPVRGAVPVLRAR
ncbi:hypothetical protein HTV45_32630 [Streptomyces sp. CHD11]|uniref:hypothetical protein n=1 Tax=Streptomyces sp. CHD11 TaxID=2741325 RepID=UPI001BFBFA49|nr:hypothetical protein [Streptomyces sp. CHD11]MBT3155532.1 hypothetical protein [Streptomyces sp. CHD11]